MLNYEFMKKMFAGEKIKKSLVLTLACGIPSLLLLMKGVPWYAFPVFFVILFICALLWVNVLPTDTVELELNKNQKTLISFATIAALTLLAVGIFLVSH